MPEAGAGCQIAGQLSSPFGFKVNDEPFAYYHHALRFVPESLKQRTAPCSIFQIQRHALEGAERTFRDENVLLVIQHIRQVDLDPPKRSGKLHPVRSGIEPSS